MQCVCVREEKMARGVRVVSIFFFIYLRVDVDVCIMRLYICVWIKQTNQRTSSTSIVCICISRLLAHFSLPSFFSFVKRTHTYKYTWLRRTSREYTRSNSLSLSLLRTDFFTFYLFALFDSQATTTNNINIQVMSINSNHFPLHIPFVSCRCWHWKWRRRRRRRRTREREEWQHTHMHRLRKGEHISGHLNRMSDHCWPFLHQTRSMISIIAHVQDSI